MNLNFNVFPVLCYLAMVAFASAFILVAGLPPLRDLTPTSSAYLALTIFFFLLPEAKKLKMGKLFEYEAKVEELKGEMRDLKQETQASLAAYTTMVSTISNSVTQSFVINIPNQDEANNARHALQNASAAPPEKPIHPEDVEIFVDESGGDRNYALAKIRMQIESELRRIVDKPTTLKEIDRESIRFLSARSLYSLLCDSHPEYKEIRSTFDYILRICNAAIHTQNIPESHAQEAISMGLQFIHSLRQVESK
ncbi:hypothetical protein [Methylomonas sp. UP202]|uniref:hypothetical protein n=1 Tax=Methylomonas sp. UP202 TaxID=3040943 RepID=UPI00143ABF36|nr:hypothetical protein [Methylomonas sp. UP202]NJA06985.1 hypothetical protein [Methylococcaceae bacterium WWC4]WGS87230.1 hypothetical protein QC632_05635 [Methylomonas sp. UP202]